MLLSGIATKEHTNIPQHLLLRITRVFAASAALLVATEGSAQYETEQVCTPRACYSMQQLLGNKKVLLGVLRGGVKRGEISPAEFSRLSPLDFENIPVTAYVEALRKIDTANKRADAVPQDIDASDSTELYTPGKVLEFKAIVEKRGDSNVRTISPEDVEHLRKLIVEHGMVQVVLSAEDCLPCTGMLKPTNTFAEKNEGVPVVRIKTPYKRVAITPPFSIKPNTTYPTTLWLRHGEEPEEALRVTGYLSEAQQVAHNKIARAVEVESTGLSLAVHTKQGQRITWHFPLQPQSTERRLRLGEHLVIVYCTLANTTEEKPRWKFVVQEGVADVKSIEWTDTASGEVHLIPQSQ